MQKANSYSNLRALIGEVRVAHTNDVRRWLDNVLTRITSQGANETFVKCRTNVTRDMRMRIYARELEKREKRSSDADSR